MMATISRDVGSFRQRLIEGRDHLPRIPDSGDYVVIDVTHFSTTVAELLGMGADFVHVTDERGDEFAFRESHPEALIGGGKTDDYEPHEGYDFFNSPSYVQDLPVDGRPASMTSTNGGTAVARLRRRGDEGVEVFVGGYSNARAVAEHLRDRERPTYLVCCGSDGESTMDDLLGAVLIDRYLRDQPPSEAEREHFAAMLETSKGPDYADKHETRQRDLHRYATAVDSRDVVPVLEGDRLVDASDR
jgi:2-phosphosulfolactate phosphatase